MIRLDLGSPVSCADSAFGELADVVIDPSRQCVTHLVVRPPDQHALARLVPIGAARNERSSAGVWLDSTLAEIDEFERVHGSEYLPLGERPALAPGWDVGIESMSELMPSLAPGFDALGAGAPSIDFDPHMIVTYDRVPSGMVEIRRESQVTSSDGHRVGHVMAFIVDDQQRIAELVLEHGHLWGKREIGIEIGSIGSIVSDEVVLTLTNSEVGR